MTELAVEGGCHCGDVRYRGKVDPTVVAHICHCRSCQRASGAPMVAWLWFRAEDFSFVKGEPARYRYNYSGEEGAWAERLYCGRCGSYLAYINDRRVRNGTLKFIDVTLCSLDDPDAFPPTSHGEIEDKRSWVEPWELSGES